MGEVALNRPEARVVAAVLAHERQADAAAEARMSLRTLQRILARAHVQTAIAAESVRRLRRMTVALARHAERAAEVLGGMAGGELPPSLPRVAACRAVVEFSLRALELDGVEERLAGIEARLSTSAALPAWGGQQ